MYHQNFPKTKMHNAIVVTGSWMTVKEQMPDLYAAKLALFAYNLAPSAVNHSPKPPIVDHITHLISSLAKQH